MGRNYLGQTHQLGGQSWYLEIGHRGTCDACDEAFSTQDRVYRRTFGFLFNKEAHFVHEGCMGKYASEMDGIIGGLRTIRQAGSE